MLNPHHKWPLALDAGREPLFWRILFFIFIAALLMDAPVTIAVAGLPEFVRAPFNIITRPGNSDWILIPTLLATIAGFAAAAFLKAEGHKLRAKTIGGISLFVFAGVGIPGLIANFLKRLIGRARPVHFDELGPFHFEPFDITRGNWSFHSFPSGDTTTMFAFAAIFGFFFPKYRWLAILAAIAVGIARIMLGMHFPSDVLGGILCGTFGAYAVRNFCLARGWLFAEDKAGRIHPKINWA